MENPETYEFVLPSMWMGIVVVVAFFAILYYVGYRAMRMTATADDFYAAGFSVGPVVNALAMVATWASLATFMGVIALIYKLQVPFVYLWIQWALSIPLITLLYGTCLRRMKAYTPATFIKARYGNEATVLVVIWGTLAMIMYALGQMIGLGMAFEVLFGIPYNWGIVVVGIATIVFITLGSMYGLTHNAAFMSLVMILTMVLPLGGVMHAMGSSGWWFPPLAYGDMVPAMLDELPNFFDMTYSYKWYFSLIPALTLGPVALPHLAMRVFTSGSVKSARWNLPWFVFFLGLLFSATYTAGFAGNMFTAVEGLAIAPPDQTILALNVYYNPDIVAALVIGGVLAGGLSTIGGNLMAISGLVGNDLMNVIKPNAEHKSKVTVGYVALAVAGLIALLLAFRPPPFLVVSILWAFGLLATTVTPAILLGVWWKQTNKLAVIISSIVSGLVYIIISPHAFSGFVVGDGVTAALGMAGGMVTVPLAFMIVIIFSVAFNKLNIAPVTQEEKQVIDRIHGWGSDYEEKRYNGTLMPVLMVLVSLVVFIWGLQPW